MQKEKNILHSPSVRLTRQDLIRFEHFLKDEIGALLPFKSYSLYFPQTVGAEMLGEDAQGRPEFHGVALNAERKVLIPLALGDELLAVFASRGVSLRAPATTLPLLVQLGRLCLEKLLLYKISISDPLTGLATGSAFLDSLTREIEVIRKCALPGASGCPDFAMPSYRAGLGLIYARVDSLTRVQRAFSYELADRLLATMAAAFGAVCPEQALAARWREDGFLVLVPEAQPNASRKLAEALAEALAECSCLHALTEERVRATVSLGYVNFPQDMDGAVYERASSEQARALIAKAAKAAEKAQEYGANRVLAFNRILDQAGRVLHALPGDRATVNLGRAVDARDGQRFLVWSPSQPQPGHEGELPPVYKGEISLLEVKEEQALAEILHVGDPTLPIEAGDRLTLLKESHGPSEASPQSLDGEPRKDPLTGLFHYRDFLRLWTRRAEPCELFVLGLVRLFPEKTSEQTALHKHADQLVAEAAGLARDVFGPELEGGRYSLNSLLLFHPNCSDAQAVESYGQLCERLAANGMEAAVGLAYHPCLAYRKSDALENALKALDYGLLLPKPHVGLFDSLTLNISADRLFSQGDLYGAMEEYKLALLTDETNNLARNSLGICLARLGKLNQARALFEDVIRRDPRDVMALYNIGHVLQRQGELADAAAAYKRSLKIEPEHIYSQVRLGQLAERQGKLAQARKHYLRAAKSKGGEGLTHRYLARLCLRENKQEEAREHLHQALIHDPKDALALHLLAKLYLDRNEDPEIAVSLARQSVSLKPEQKPFWLELARGLDAAGNPRDAQAARGKAEAL
jgi:GGDEF domain-containing protein/Tfp pilus assembly protein PilF